MNFVSRDNLTDYPGKGFAKTIDLLAHEATLPRRPPAATATVLGRRPGADGATHALVEGPWGYDPLTPRPVGRARTLRLGPIDTRFLARHQFAVVSSRRDGTVAVEWFADGAAARWAYELRRA